MVFHTFLKSTLHTHFKQALYTSTLSKHFIKALYTSTLSKHFINALYTSTLSKHFIRVFLKHFRNTRQGITKVLREGITKVLRQGITQVLRQGITTRYYDKIVNNSLSSLLVPLIYRGEVSRSITSFRRNFNYSGGHQTQVGVSFLSGDDRTSP